MDFMIAHWACGIYTMGMQIYTVGMWILHNGHVDFEHWLGQVEDPEEISIVPHKGTKKTKKEAEKAI
jgi:hypothetical protein